MVWIGYMRLVVYSLTGCLLCSTAVAKYCVKLPTCEELGYIYSADKYPNNRSIKCPFDTKKILLLDYCQAYGLTSCDSTSGECDECIVEKADGTKSNSGYWRYTRCNAGYSYKSGECPPTEVDTSKYPFTQGELNEEIGEVECVQSAQNVYCGYKSCNEGWDINSGNCIVHDCGSSYPYTSCDTNGTCGECKSGENTKYSAPTCNLGWYTSGSACVENDCSAFTSATSSITGCSSSSSCLSGTKTTYKCDTCYTGYEVLNGACNKTCTYTATAKPSSCATATGLCQLGSASGNTTYYATTCSTCNNGYEVSSGSCVAAACTGYTSTSSTITGCQTVSSACLSGTTNKYKCNTCYTGYSLNSGACNKTCTYTATIKPSNCATATGSCQLGAANGITTYYATTCSICNSGYEVSSGNCVAATCTGYTSTSSTIANCSTTSSCQKGATTVYKCKTCASGFEADGSGGCKSSCAYTATSKPTGCSVADSCVKNGTTYYATTCATCNNGYNDDDGDGMCVANTCSGYPSTSTSITGCKTVSSSCLAGTTKKYKCNTCYTGYYQSGGKCYANSCSYYEQEEECADVDYTDSCLSGEKTLYRCKKCKESIIDENGVLQTLKQTCDAGDWVECCYYRCPDGCDAPF